MLQLVGGNKTKRDKQKYEYKDTVYFYILALYPPKFPGIFINSKLIPLWNKKLLHFHCSFWHFYSRTDRGGVWESEPQQLLWSSFLQSRLSFSNFYVSTCLLHLSPSGCWLLFSKDGCFAFLPNFFLHKEPRNSLKLIISPLVLYFCSISKSDFYKMKERLQACSTNPWQSEMSYLKCNIKKLYGSVNRVQQGHGGMNLTSICFGIICCLMDAKC